MAYKPAYIWNGTGWDQIGNQAVASLDDYALLNPSASANQTITNTTFTSASLVSASLVNGDISGTISGTKTISGTTTHSGNLEVTGRLDSTDIREQVSLGTISSNILTANYPDGTIYFISSAPSANFTVNVTNVPTDNNKAITIVVLVTQGSTGYIPSALQVGGAAQTIKWIGGTAPTPTSSAGKIDVFNFTLIRISSAWTVIGNSSLNF